MRKSLVCLALLLGFMSVRSYADDLNAIYAQAAANNATYQAAEATYQAAGYGLPIARGSLLPSLTGTANTTANRQTGSSGYYNSNGFSLELTQPLFVVGAWYGYSEAEATYKAAAVTYAEALQNLIMTTANAYFGVLEAEDQLKYAIANQESLKEQMKQTEAQYKVGLQALTDVQSTDASYQSAIASTVAAENSLADAKANLTAVTGEAAPPLAPLRQNFPLLKPNPLDPDAWVKFGMQNNLTLQAAELQTEIDRLGIRVDATTGYLPTVSAVGTFSNNKNTAASPSLSSSDSSASTGSSTASANTGSRTKTTSGALQLNWNVFNGGTTYATVKQDQYNYQAAVSNEAQTRLQTEANIREAYLNVLSDISQVQAYQQAVVSGQASLVAMKAGYLVGTQTIVDVLTQQSDLYSSEQSYADAIYNYITDSLTLKEQAGNLAPGDIAAVNDWLDNSRTPAGTTNS